MPVFGTLPPCRIFKMQCVQIPVAKTVEYSIHSITGLTEEARKWNYIQIYHSNGTFVVKKLMQSQIEILTFSQYSFYKVFAVGYCPKVQPQHPIKTHFTGRRLQIYVFN